MTDKFRAGDVIKVRIDEGNARNLNKGSKTFLFDDQILSVERAPEPIVGWVNVYEGGMVCYNYREKANEDDRLEEKPRTALVKLTCDPASKTVTSEVVS